MVGESNEVRQRADRSRVGRPALVEFPERGVPGFGELLRRHRLRAGFSQVTLAERASLSERAISDLERGLKSQPQAATFGLLAAALGLAPDEREELAAAARRKVAPRLVVPPSLPGAVPLPLPPTALIGREAAISNATSLLTTGGVALLTVTGPGGIGKSHFALALADQLRQHYRDGVYFVALAALREVGTRVEIRIPLAVPFRGEPLV